MSLFLDIRKNPDLSQSERFIAEYIITHPNNIMEMTMDELAQATFTSRSSVLRLCKKNGYKGFHELKTQLAIELNLYLKDNSSEMIALPFSNDASISEIVDNMAAQNLYSILETSRTNSTKRIEQSVDWMSKAQRLLVFGYNDSEVVAIDAVKHFAKLGVNIPLMHMAGPDMLTCAQFSTPQDVAILISYGGEDAVLIQIGNILGQNNTKCISVTGNADNPLSALCGINLYVNSTDSLKKNLSTTSRIAALNLMDSLFMCYLSKNYEKIKRLIE